MSEPIDRQPGSGSEHGAAGPDGVAPASGGASGGAGDAADAAGARRAPLRFRRPSEPTVLFTGFEPSGDDHASSVISVLRRRHPGLKMYAWGGPKMAEAGAEVVERTGKDAVMGLPGLAKIREHQQINLRIRAWLAEHPITLHVPVDSPAANFPICAMTRQTGARVMHLVAPQLWAWGSWRIRKLRRLTDHVCCLLPFEEEWFRSRGVPATFVGHPLFDEPIDRVKLERRASVWRQQWGERGPRVGLMPGSRPAEMRRNFPVLLAAFRRLKREHPGMQGVVAATSADVEAPLREMAEAAGGWPEDLNLVAGETDAAIAWSDLCVVVSGTVTLQVARQARPMVIVYKTSPALYWLLGRWLVNAPFFTLPNLVAGDEIVPELVPHFSGPDAIVDEVVGLLERPELAERQREHLRAVADRFRGRHAARSAADQIERMMGLAVGEPAGDAAPDREPAGSETGSRG